MSFLAEVRATRNRLEHQQPEEGQPIQVPLQAARDALLETSERVDEATSQVIQRTLASYAGSSATQESDLERHEAIVKKLEGDGEELAALLQEKMGILAKVGQQREELMKVLFEEQKLASANASTYLQNKLVELGRVGSTWAADRTKSRGTSSVPVYMKGKR